MAGRQTLDPPSAKFPNGHLYSNATQESQGIPFSGSDRGSGSDMDLSSDSDEHVYDGEYSFISSPQDDKVPNGVTAIHAASLKKSEAQCHGGTQLKLANGAGRTAQVYGGKLETGEEQFSYSACSTEVSFMQYRSNNDVPSHGEAHNSYSYSSTVTLG